MHRTSSPAVSAVAWCLGAFVGAMLSENSSASAQEPVIPIRCHIWGPFEVGAWVRTSVDTEVYEGGERVHHLQRVITRVLRQRGNETYLLEIETLERTGLAGVERERRRVDREELRWFVAADQLKPDVRAESELDWFGRTLNCQVFEYEVSADGRKVHHRDLFHAEQFPFFLSRLALKMSETAPDQVEYREFSQVIENSVPIVLGEHIVDGVITKTTLESPDRRVTVLEELAAEVPGGLVSKRVVELNGNGQVVRREVVSLLDFGDASDWERAEGGEDEREVSRPRGRLFRRWTRLQGEAAEETDR